MPASSSKPRRPPVTSLPRKPCRIPKTWLVVISRTTEASGALPADARALLSASAVRMTAHRVLSLALEHKLEDWSLDWARLPAAADFVAAVIRERYPRLD